MGKDQEKRYVCKLCNKSFLSGKVLGGHMRVHLAAKSVKKNVKIQSDNMSFDGYVLRENPKKSWRFGALKHKLSPEIEGVVKCYVCEKEFESPRSLHGHMRHHSKLERKGVHCQECGKAFKTLRALTGHMRLHSKKLTSSPNLGFLSLTNAESMNLVRRKRSKRVRYRATPNCSFSSLSESVPDFEIDQEVAEVAMCLIMMSRGVHDFGVICSVCGCSCDHCMCQNKIVRSDVGDGFVEVNQFVKEKAVEDFNICPSDPQNKALQCSEYDCEIVNYEKMKVGIEFDSHNRSELVLWNAEANLEIHGDMNFNPNVAEAMQDLVEDVGFSVGELTLAETYKSTEDVINSYNAEIGEPSWSDKAMCSAFSFGMVDDVPKMEFKCKICSKILPTYQALGGHQTGHRTSLNMSLATGECQKNTSNEHLSDNEGASKLEHSENSVEMEGIALEVEEEAKRSKEYRCEICYKTFVSGQALGGHKRAHVSKMREEESVAITQEATDMFGTTNLTDMIDAGTNSGIGFGAWWSQNSCHHQSLASLVAN